MSNVQDKTKFFNDLTTLARVPPLKPVVVEMYNQVAEMREKFLPIYKNFHYKIVDDANFLVCYDSLCWPQSNVEALYMHVKNTLMPMQDSIHGSAT